VRAEWRGDAEKRVPEHISHIKGAPRRVALHRYFSLPIVVALAIARLNHSALSDKCTDHDEVFLLWSDRVDCVSVKFSHLKLIAAPNQLEF
jgi:hypothetical protein